MINKIASRHERCIQHQCHVYILWVALVCCLACRYGLARFTCWALWAQGWTLKITEKCLDKGDFVCCVTRNRFHAVRVCTSLRSWAYFCTLLICLCSLMCACDFASSVQVEHKNRISLSNSRDPLITSYTVAARIGYQVWTHCPKFFHSFCKFEWIFVVLLGRTCARSVIPSFRRILHPPKSFQKKSNTSRNRGYSKCGRGVGRCRNHATRCIDFYMNDCIAQHYQHP